MAEQQEALSVNDAVPAGVIRDLQDGQEIRAAFVVRSRELRQKKNGEDYLRVELADKTGSLTGLDWDGGGESFKTCEVGAVVIAAGSFSEHPTYGKQIKLAGIRAANPEEYDVAQLQDGPARSAAELEEDLRSLILTVRNPPLRTLLDNLLGPESETWPRFRDAPAARRVHQAYPGGLLEHTVTVATGVRAAASLFPGIDHDVALTGALLHDFGKMEAYNDDPLAIELTDAGKLEGEIPLSYFKVKSALAAVESDQLHPRPVPPELARAVLHIVVSHHGKPEHGSPVYPATREATLVHAVDALAARLGSFDRLEKGLQEGETWSPFDSALDGSVFFG